MLPKGWVETELGSLMLDYDVLDPRLSPEQRFLYVEIGSIDNKIQKIVSPKLIIGNNAPSRARRVIKEGDIIFSTVRPYLKNISVVPNELDNQLTSTGMCVIRTNELIDTRYIFLLICSDKFLEEVSLKQDGTLYPAVSDRDVADAKVPLPPLAEQRRIVAKLDSLTARIARARAELERVQVLKVHLRRQALHSCFADLGKHELRLGELLHGIEAGKNMRCVERPPVAGEKGVVKVSAVTWGRFDATQTKTLPSDYLPPTKARIMKDDLLISRANTLELVGAAAIVDFQPDNIFLSDKILRLIVDENKKTWILWYLRSPEGRSQIESLATGNQLSMRNISQAALRQIKIPLPEISIRQQRLTRLTAAIKTEVSLETEAKRALTLLDRLESSLLAKAFRGELVPQDPNDEPASVLLDRIRAERAAAPKPKRGRKA